MRYDTNLQQSHQLILDTNVKQNMKPDNVYLSSLKIPSHYNAALCLSLIFDKVLDAEAMECAKLRLKSPNFLDRRLGAETAISNPRFFLAVKPLGGKTRENRGFFSCITYSLFPM